MELIVVLVSLELVVFEVFVLEVVITEVLFVVEFVAVVVIFHSTEVFMTSVVEVLFHATEVFVSPFVFSTGNSGINIGKSEETSDNSSDKEEAFHFNFSMKLRVDGFVLKPVELFDGMTKSSQRAIKQATEKKEN
ncbi:MAG: hypothetical protein R3C11_15840 [Planctomycetaceae bacterium]